MKLKKTNKVLGLLAVAAFGFGSAASQAALIDRGGGLIYDDVLNVTWLQDASYAATSGSAPFGSLQWQEAHDWAAGLEYYDSARGVVWDDWRLPSTINAQSSWGWDTTGTTSELAYMYYVNLGYAPDFEPIPSDPFPSGAGYNPFINIVYRSYWSDTQNVTEYAGTRAWYLHMHFGEQGEAGLTDYLKVWGVRDGDVGLPTVSTVPVPGSFGLFAAAMGLAAFMRRRKPLAI